MALVSQDEALLGRYIGMIESHGRSTDHRFWWALQGLKQQSASQRAVLALRRLAIIGFTLPFVVLAHAKTVSRMTLPRPVLSELTAVILATEALANAYRAQDDEQIEIGLRDLEVAVERSRIVAKARVVPIDRLPASSVVRPISKGAQTRPAMTEPLVSSKKAGGRPQVQGTPLLSPAMEFHLSKQLEPLRQMVDVTRNSPHSERRDRVADLFVAVAHLVRVYAFDSRFKIYFCPQNRMTWVQTGARGQYPFADSQFKNCAVRAP